MSDIRSAWQCCNDKCPADVECVFYIEGSVAVATSDAYVPRCVLCNTPMLFVLSAPDECAELTAAERKEAWEIFKTRALLTGLQPRYLDPIVAMAAAYISELSDEEAEQFDDRDSPQWKIFFGGIKRQFPEWFGGSA
jgi:hypothetical protein